MFENLEFESIFFCSAYNDVSHILALIERKKVDGNLIIVVNNYQCYKYLDMLNIINTNILFLSSKLLTFKNPINWIRERKNIRNINNNILKRIRNAEVVFFATFYDLLTCKCIDILKSNNKVYLSIPIEDDFIASKKISPKDKLLSLIYKLKFQSFIRFNNKVTGLPLFYVKKYLNTDLVAAEEELQFVRKKYAIKVNKNKPFILFLDAEDNYDEIINNYFQDISKVFNLLTNYNTYIKGHPRLGVSKIALTFNFKKIDSYIPIEFINLSNCKCVIGIESIALANIANQGINAISLLKILDYKDSSIRNGWIGYLERYCKSNIYYSETIDEFKEKLYKLNFVTAKKE